MIVVNEAYVQAVEERRKELADLMEDWKRNPAVAAFVESLKGRPAEGEPPKPRRRGAKRAVVKED